MIHGTADRMITAPHGEVLARELNAGAEEKAGRGVKLTMFQGNGHVLPWEKREEFTRLIEELVRDTEALGKEDR